MSIKAIAAIAFGAILGVATSSPASAQQGGMGQGSMMGQGGMGGGAQSGMMGAQPGPMADGEIRRVNRDAGKLTIKHGPIPSMDMPPMTMVYRVEDPRMLDKVKPGDRIRFDARKVGGQYVVIRMEPAN